MLVTPINLSPWMILNFLSKLVLAAMVTCLLLMTKQLMRKPIMQWNVLKRIKFVTANRLVIWCCKKRFFAKLIHTHSLLIVSTFSRRMISCSSCLSSCEVVIFSIIYSQLRDSVRNRLNSLLPRLLLHWVISISMTSFTRTSRARIFLCKTMDTSNLLISVLPSSWKLGNLLRIRESPLSTALLSFWQRTSVSTNQLIGGLSDVWSMNSLLVYHLSLLRTSYSWCSRLKSHLFASLMRKSQE